MSADWQWDPTLFAGAARYYDRGRYPYAPGLADAMRDALGLDGRGRLLDVGCGPGTVALRLAHLFESVVGLDSDPEMLDEAARLAAERGIDNTRWVHMRAEELPAGLGTFRVVTFAASFHWMDRDAVAHAVRRMLDAGGAVVHVDNLYRVAARMDGRNRIDPGPDAPFPPEPWDAINALVQRYLGAGRRAGQSVRESSPNREDLVFRAAGFDGPEVVPVPGWGLVERRADDVVALVLSMSSSAPHLFGDRLPAFEADLRALLAEASPAGRFSVRLRDNVLNIYRPV